MENMPTGEGWRGVAEALLNWQQASSSLFVYMNTEAAWAGKFWRVWSAGSLGSSE